MYVDTHGRPAPWWRVLMMYAAYCFMGLAMLWAAGSWYVNDLRAVDFDDEAGMDMIVPVLVGIAMILRTQSWHLKRAQRHSSVQAKPEAASSSRSR